MILGNNTQLQLFLLFDYDLQQTAGFGEKSIFLRTFFIIVFSFALREQLKQQIII